MPCRSRCSLGSLAVSAGYQLSRRRLCSYPVPRLRSVGRGRCRRCPRVRVALARRFGSPSPSPRSRSRRPSRRPSNAGMPRGSSSPIGCGVRLTPITPPWLRCSRVSASLSPRLASRSPSRSPSATARWYSSGSGPLGGAPEGPVFCCPVGVVPRAGPLPPGGVSGPVGSRRSSRGPYGQAPLGVLCGHGT